MSEKFPMGHLVITRSALDSLDRESIDVALRRHSEGDWGELDEEDRRENERSLEEGLRLLSSYRAKDGTVFWIITEADRSATTVLLPEDY